jgi:hypothetical protein
VNTTINGATRYLVERRALGFNAINVNLIESLFSTDPPRNLAGDEPFLTPGDFATPNPAYFDHAERVLELIAGHGMLVFLAPAYLGLPDHRYPGYGGRSEGWYETVLANDVAGNRVWGEYLGRRFGRFDNIIWMIGGDRDPGLALAPLDALAHGIRHTGVRALFTAHVYPEHSPVDVFPGVDWLDVNPTYTYGIVHKLLIEDWNRTPPVPFLLLSSSYEGEHDASALQIRRQAYWAVLCGGNGHLMGNKPMWMFGDGWQNQLRSPGSLAMARWGSFFRSLPWYDLEPDVDHVFATAGLGEANGLDRVTAAVTGDATVAVAYLPVRRELMIDTRRLVGPRLAIDWFEPKTGRRTAGPEVMERGPIVFKPPFRYDSVLTITSLGA